MIQTLDSVIFLWRMLSFVASNDMTCRIPRSCGSSAEGLVIMSLFHCCPWALDGALNLETWSFLLRDRPSPVSGESPRCSPGPSNLAGLKCHLVSLTPGSSWNFSAHLSTFHLLFASELLGVSSWSLWNSVLSQGVHRSFYSHFGVLPPTPPWPFSFRIVPVDSSCPNSPKLWPLSS